MTRLHSAEMPAVWDALARCPDQPLDLTRLTFASPSGVVWLLAALRTLARTHDGLVVLPPPDDRPLHHWLRWMGFYDELAAAGIRCDTPAPRDPLPGSAERLMISQGLLPILRIAGPADVVAVARDAVGRVGSLLEAELGYDRRDVAAIALVLSEACNNVWEHAGPGAVGFVAAQRFVPRRGSAGRPYLLVGVADDGCGIRSSLARAHPDALGGSDESAVRRALEAGISGVPGEERGLGLPTVAAQIARYRGTLHLRSGAAHLRLKARDTGEVEERLYASPALPTGTMLCLTFQARD